MFRIKGGTVGVLVEAEHDAPAIEHPPLTLARVRKAAHFSLDRFGEGSDRFARRFLRLGLLLLAVYALSGAAYVITVMAAYQWTTDPTWTVLGSMTAAAASLVFGAWLTVVNLLYLLLQVLVVANDWPVRTAARALPALLVRQRRLIGGIFLVMLVLVVLATVASVLATARAGLHRLCPHRGTRRAAAAAAGLAGARPAVPVPGTGRTRGVCRCRTRPWLRHHGARTGGALFSAAV